MICPEEINKILLKILGDGILRIRFFADKGDLDFCRFEANHLHNLPALLQDFSWEFFDFYLNTEVKQYLCEAEGKISPEFKNDLQSLEMLRKDILTI